MPTQTNSENRDTRGGNFATVFPDGATITSVKMLPSPLKPGTSFGIVSVANDNKTYTVSGVFARLVSEAVITGERHLPAKVRAKALEPDGVKYKYRVFVPEWLD